MRTGGDIHRYRKIAEALIGRKLIKDEQVHHKDGDFENNKMDNLEILTRVEHQSRHPNSYGTLCRKINKDDPLLVWCSSCKQFKKKEDFHKNKNRWTGVTISCKECNHKLHKLWYSVNQWKKAKIG